MNHLLFRLFGNLPGGGLHFSATANRLLVLTEKFAVLMRSWIPSYLHGRSLDIVILEPAERPPQFSSTVVWIIETTISSSSSYYYFLMGIVRWHFNTGLLALYE
jgi:hypothetical protein